MVVKPSELAPACSSLLYRTIPLYLDTEAIKIIEGGSDIAEQLLQHQWDKIFFTGLLSVVMTSVQNSFKLWHIKIILLRPLDCTLYCY